MAYCIQYFNDELDDIVVDFLGLQIVTEATAVVLHRSFKEFLSAYGLPLQNLVGLGTHGASNLCAVNKKDENNSLWTYYLICNSSGVKDENNSLWTYYLICNSSGVFVIRCTSVPKKDERASIVY